jgi:hypothetical protein
MSPRDVLVRQADLAIMIAPDEDFLLGQPEFFSAMFARLDN